MLEEHTLYHIKNPATSATQEIVTNHNGRQIDKLIDTRRGSVLITEGGSASLMSVDGFISFKFGLGVLAVPRHSSHLLLRDSSSPCLLTR